MQTINSLKSASHLRVKSITEDFVFFEWSKSEFLIATNAFFLFLVPITRL